MVNSFLIRIDTLTENAGVINSSVGMETNLVGATLDFPITRQQECFPFHPPVEDMTLVYSRLAGI